MGIATVVSTKAGMQGGRQRAGVEQAEGGAQ